MRKILLVDDDFEIISILQDYLEEHDLMVFTNNTGDNVIEQIIQNEPNIVVLDVNLKGNSGFDILRKIKSNPLTNFIPVVMLTGESTQNSQIEGLTSGADDYIIKPFNLNVLYARLLTAFKRSLIRTRTKFDQINLLNHLINIYTKRGYDIFSKMNNHFDDSPFNWNAYTPDLIICKKNKTRVFLFESAQSILEEAFLKRLEEISLLKYNEKKVEANLVVRSRETYKQCREIINEYRFNIKMKLITKKMKLRKVIKE